MLSTNNLLINKILRIIVSPFAPIYWILIFLRNYFYDHGFAKVKSLGIPVISIGNLTLGGTGKTPMTIFIAQHFKSRGKKVGILSRGYKRESKGTKLVTDGVEILNDFKHYGDEPYLMAKKTKNIPIVVDKNRFRGGEYLINHFNLDLIILDDGYQHRSLKRNLDILLINNLDKKKNYKLFPLGNLREPLKNLKRADIIIKTKSNFKSNDQAYFDSVIKGAQIEHFSCKFETSISNRFTKPQFLKTDLTKKRSLIVTAIGDPLSFKKSVSFMKCKIVKQLNFKDHYNYSQGKWEKIEALCLKLNVEFILTTEKDWIKIENLKTKIPIIVFGLKIYFNNSEAFYNILENVN